MSHHWTALERAKGVSFDVPVPFSHIPAWRSGFPDDAIALIAPRTRQVGTCGKARARGWDLRFKPRSAPFVDPLTEWTGSRDPLAQVQLTFPTLAAAMAYAEHQGLRFEIRGARGSGPD